MIWVAYGNTRSLAERQAVYKKELFRRYVCVWIYEENSWRKWMWTLGRNGGTTIHSQIVWLILFIGTNEPLKIATSIGLVLKFKSKKIFKYLLKFQLRVSQNPSLKE